MSFPAPRPGRPRLAARRGYVVGPDEGEAGWRPTTGSAASPGRRSARSTPAAAWLSSTTGYPPVTPPEAAQLPTLSVPQRRTL